MTPASNLHPSSPRKHPLDRTIPRVDREDDASQDRTFFARCMPIALSIVLLAAAGCATPARRQLVLYSDPEGFMTFRLAWHFTKETSIQVKQFQNNDYSGAASAARLTAERDQPQADVYWSGDPIYCELLRQRGLIATSRHQRHIPAAFRDEDDHWTGFAGRARVLLVRRNLGQDPPKSIRAYTDPAWRGRGALANPLKGTTRSHFAALATLWGDQELAAFYHALRENGTRITNTTAESADLVIAGESDFALVDNDVALAAIEKGKPVDIVYPDQGGGETGIMFIPNALAIIKGCKNPEAAQELIDFLLTRDSELRINRLAPSHIPLNAGVAILSPFIRRIEALNVLKFNYADAAQKLLQMETILEFKPKPIR
jgi:iron(III) transport system substrate-binding protein